MKKSVIKSAGIFIFAAFFRFYDLGVSPYWIDEVLLLHKVSGDVSLVQTIPYVFILRIMPFELTEFWVRFPSALFGSFMPVVFYLVFRQKNERLALAFSLVIAVFPLFVFWSRYARPYMMAGFFIICSWGNRDIYKLFLIPAVLLTPLAIIGLKPSLNKRVILYYMVNTQLNQNTKLMVKNIF